MAIAAFINPYQMNFESGLLRFRFNVQLSNSDPERFEMLEDVSVLLPLDFTIEAAESAMTGAAIAVALSAFSWELLQENIIIHKLERMVESP